MTSQDFRANIQLIQHLIGNCIVIRVTDETLQDDMILAEMNRQIEDICPVNNIYSTDRARLSGKNGISITDIPKIKPDSMYVSTLNARSNSRPDPGIRRELLQQGLLGNEERLYDPLAGTA